MNARTCGPCGACCDFFRIDELDKPEGEKCPHRSEAGCAIYATRPQSCAGYQCVWLWEGTLPEHERVLRENERPDESGIILSKGGMAVVKGRNLAWTVAQESWPGAANGYWAQKLLKRLTARRLVVLAVGQRRFLLGPPAGVRDLAEHMGLVPVGTAMAPREGGGK